MNKQELESKLAVLTSALAIAKPTMKKGIEQEIAEVQKQIEALTKDAPQNEPQDMSAFLKTVLATIATQMGSGIGGGVDSPQVRAIIKEYLGKDKVQFEELDTKILEEIRRNQTVLIQLPGFAEKIEVKNEDTDIPNFWEIVDDILAGNNVYLIGEAGGGKTFTAEKISNIIGRKYVTLNCSQYTSPLEILGGQSVDGFKQGKLIDCWRNGKVLIMDEMPKLDPNTAGLFNDALAKSSKTKPQEDARINSANADEPPILRHNDFGIIATGNIYPNEPPAPQYKGNNQQDLSLLDRFSGSVYYTEFNDKVDQKMCRYDFIYKLFVGNYYRYMEQKANQEQTDTPRGLRTVIEHTESKNLALVSYRTLIAFRVGFEYELVRAIAKKEGKEILVVGKTLAKTFDSYMVAFRSNTSKYRDLIRQTGYTQKFIQNKVDEAIQLILSGEDGFKQSLTDMAQKTSKPIYASYKSEFMVSDQVKIG